MKYIPFRDFSTEAEPNGLKTRDIIFMVANQAQHGGGAKPDEVLQRVRVLKALKRDEDAKAPGLQLEDADHENLKKWLKDIPFIVATIPLGQVIEDIMEAKEPPAILSPPKKEKEAT